MIAFCVVLAIAVTFFWFAFPDKRQAVLDWFKGVGK